MRNWGLSVAKVGDEADWVTAWLCDGDGHMLTAGHLFVRNGGRREGGGVVAPVRFPGRGPVLAELVFAEKDDARGVDFALLKVDKRALPDGCEPLPAVTDAHVSLAGRRATLYGYGAFEQNELRPAVGDVVGSTYDEGTARGWLKVSCQDAAQPGYSGCAVWCEELGGVVAIQAQGSGADVGPESASVNAMPVSRMLERCPELADLLVTPPTERDAFATRINERLREQRRSHPSFRLINSPIDDELFPSGQLRSESDDEVIPIGWRNVRSAGCDGLSFRQFLRQSWSRGRKTNLFITGKGGVGKTVALLTFATEPGFLPRGVPAVYIPLYDLSKYYEDSNRCIDMYLKDAFSDAEWLELERLSKEPWSNGPNVILLMDGYNEVPVDRKGGVEGSVRQWSLRRGVQLVTTARTRPIDNVEWEWMELRGLTRAQVVDYLHAHGIAEPRTGDNLWDVLSTPLMLKMYGNVISFSRYATDGYLLVKPSDSAGHLVWNYLQREIFRCIKHDGGGHRRVEYAACMMLTLPHVCWRMWRDRTLTIDSRRMAEYVRDACARWRGGRRPGFFEDVELQLNDYMDGLDERRFVGSQLAILADEGGLLYRRRDDYALLHQELRDGLAAIHLNNVVDASRNEVPAELLSPVDRYVRGYLADVIPTDALRDLWEANRQLRETNVVATHNILGVAHRHHAGDLASLDWSGMDVREVSLFEYRSGLRLRISARPEHYEGTRLSARCFRRQGHRGSVVSVAFSQDGRQIVSGGSDATVRVWDADSYRQEGAFNIGYDSKIVSVGFAQDDDCILVGSWRHGVQLFSAGPEPRVRWATEECAGMVFAASPSPRDPLVASGSFDDAIRLWDLRDGSQVGSPLTGHGGSVESVCFSPDGTLLASGSYDGTVRLWDVKSHAQVGEALRGHSGPVWSVCFSPDGGTIASGSMDGTICLWDAGAGRRIGHPLRGHKSSVESVCFSPDGLTVASGSQDTTVRIWDVTTQTQLGTPLRGLSDTVRSVCFDPNGGRVAVGAATGSVIVWRGVDGRFVRDDPLALQPGGQEAFAGIDISGLDFTRAKIPGEDKKVFRISGAKVAD